MVYSDLEAAEALAGLGRSSSHISPSPDWELLADKRYKINREGEKIVETLPDRRRKNMNEAEKESKKLKRILANRESARQTIRRRQDLYVGLTRNAAELTEENLKLKEAKKLLLEEFNSAKDRNTYLKKELEKVEKAKLEKAKVVEKAAESRERQEEPKSSSKAEMPRSVTNTPTYPSLVPCFWPPVLPSSDVFQFHCPGHTDLTSSSQFLVPNRETPCCSHRNSTPIYVLPVPWLFPYQPNATPAMFHPNVGTNDVHNEISSSQPCSMCSSSDNNQLSLDLNVTAAEMVSDSTVTTTCVCSMQGPHLSLPEGRCSVLFPDINTVSTHEHSSRHPLFPKNQDPKMHHLKIPGESFAASEARRKRKELIKLKNTPCHHDHVPT